MTKVEIGPANVRDITYILSNLRKQDELEISCQTEAGSVVSMATLCVQPGHSWVAYHNGVPAMAFGFTQGTLAGNVLNAWAFGTKRTLGCIRTVTRWIYNNLGKDWIRDGKITRIEARTIFSHTGAHSWLERTGARCEGKIPEWGRDGETFLLYVWRRGDFNMPGSAGRRKLRKFIRR